MADEQDQRPYRTRMQPPRRAAAATAGSDPLAELARLIGQTDPVRRIRPRQRAPRGCRRHRRRPPDMRPPPRRAGSVRRGAGLRVTEYFGAAGARRATAGAGRAAALRRARTSAAGLRRSGICRGRRSLSSATMKRPAMRGDAAISRTAAGDDDHDSTTMPRRCAGAWASWRSPRCSRWRSSAPPARFGYRALFGSSAPSRPPPVIKADTAPSKIVPASASKTPNKLITDRVADHAQGEKLVSREEKPVEMKDKPVARRAADQRGATCSRPARQHGRARQRRHRPTSRRKSTPSPSDPDQRAWAKPAMRRQRAGAALRRQHRRPRRCRSRKPRLRRGSPAIRRPGPPPTPRPRVRRGARPAPVHTRRAAAPRRRRMRRCRLSPDASPAPACARRRCAPRLSPRRPRLHPRRGRRHAPAAMPCRSPRSAAKPTRRPPSAACRPNIPSSSAAGRR